MSGEEVHYAPGAPGGHYSGHNKIPTIQQFIENLDTDKKLRDKRIDEQNKLASPSQAQWNGRPVDSGSDARPHKVLHDGIKGTQKSVTDPTTGRQVIIEDVNRETMLRATDPTVGAEYQFNDHHTNTSPAFGTKCQPWKGHCM